MENKKESFFKTAIASIKDFDKYQDLNHLVSSAHHSFL